MTGRIYRIAALIALILLSGWASLKLAVPPGYGSPIWPPAGIALAALLLWGRACWPAIWVAAFALHLWLAVTQGAELSTGALLSAAGIACGSTLQALIAAWLVQRRGSLTVPRLDTPRTILRFFALAGPLACLIAPTVGVGTLLAVGIMPASAAFFSWWNWWIGDSMGVIIVAPLMFCLLATPRELWVPRRLTVALPQWILLAALIAVFIFVFRAERSHLQLEFDNRAEVIDQRLSERLNQIINGSLSLQGFYDASTTVSREDFHAFSRNILERYPEIQVLEWIPRVPQGQLRQFERSVRAQGYPRFMVRERMADGTLAQAGERAEYYPILFIEPFAGNDQALGYDSASDQLNWYPKALAIASGMPTVSQRLKLVQDAGKGFGVLISTPVYRRESTHLPAHLSGFVSSIFRPEQMVRRALDGMHPEQFGMTLRDLNAPPTERELFDLPIRQALAQGDGLKTWQHSFMFGDREWQLVVTPDRSFIAAHGSPLAWVTLIGGLIFTAMLNIYLLTITGQTAQVRSLVEKRTREVQESEKRLRFLLETSPIAIRIATNGGRKVVFANPKYHELIMTKPGHGLSIDPKTYYANPHDYEEILHELAQGRPVDNRLVEISIPGQAKKWVLASYLPIQYEGTEAFIGWFYDITDRRQSEDKLLLAARVFSEAHEGITITDAHGVIIDINPMFSEITGYSREDAIGKSSSLLKSGKHDDEFYRDMWQTLIEQGHWQGEVWNRKKSGEVYAELLSISTLHDDHGRPLHFVGLFSDITQSKHQQQALEMMAHYDVLTRLPNRVLFADRFSQAIAHCKRDTGTLLAVCYLDLDGFKLVNDNLGHEAGDRLLVEVAERIKSILREADTVSRLGGDEFALLLGEIHSLEQCEQALERIHHTLSQPYLLDGQGVSISASSGVAIYPLDDADPDTLLRHADQAMYQAKQAGRNRYHLFDAEHDLRMQQHRLQLETIEQAFERNEFRLFYQPKVNMRTGEVIGAEALIRWNHPQRGTVQPAEFLPALAGTPIEVLLGNWVIEEAMRQIELWNAAGLDLQISVNISPRHLQWQGFFAYLSEALSRYPNTPSRQLELEVLESSVVEDVANISKVLSGCRDALGVSIALDDFGTGYSSLTHLRHLPANMIKIDQTFVRDMLDDPDDYAIIEGVIGLADAFRREVIAEGVETAEHGLLLLNMGCVLAQGYGIARPMPAAELPAWIKHYRPYPEWQVHVQHPPSGRAAFELSLKLEIHQWVRRMDDSLNAPVDAEPRWPIMNPTRCHCGRWTMRAKRESFYSDHRLGRFIQAHERMHHIGHQLMMLFLQGKSVNALAGLPELQTAHEEMLRILAEID